MKTCYDIPSDSVIVKKERLEELLLIDNMKNHLERLCNRLAEDNQKLLKQKNMQKITLENLFLDKLDSKQLKSLLPCIRPDVQELIESRIAYLNHNK